MFFLPRPPRTRQVDVEFRGLKRREPAPVERLHMRTAARLQRGLAWVSAELAAEAPQIPKVEISVDPEQAAAQVRMGLGIAPIDQISWRSPSEAQRQWRSALERQGVVVLFQAMGPEAVQGFSMWHDQVPLIAVNTHWAAQARSHRAWTMTRTNWSHFDVDTISALFEIADPVKLRTAGDPLPTGSRFRLYRGVSGKGRWRKEPGPSWTRSAERAAWFANRSAREDPAVLTTEADPNDTLAYLGERSGRGEDEFIVFAKTWERIISVSPSTRATSLG
jgi:hypothetical protein